MLTLHRATVLVVDPAAPSIPDGAVLVDGGTVAALGPYAELAGGGARVREWDGLLTPGLLNPYGRWLLETAYHPDPREELGTEPLLTAVPEERRGGSARLGLQRLLAHGVTALAGPFTLPAVRTAVARSGLTALPGTGTPGGLDPLADAPLASVVHRPLTVGGRADLAVFAAASVAELERLGAGCCLATVLGGRLLYRRR
ncbi:hypothetical protein OHV05_19930 [Kitasatospora sp. NBC_00070]|uniref:amidohydrolase family protein n=1 Tax=Kitasatospora sp. NBC_00070 TaxID=2975962 RepID=UPI003248EDE1